MEHTEGMGENITGLLNGMYTQYVVPREWNTADAFQLGKANGKKGCKAIRLINLLAPEGKAFYKLVWEESPEKGGDWSYGFRKGKRREQARTQGWR